MGRWGSVDFEGFKQLRANLERAINGGMDDLCERCAKKLAAQLLSMVIKRTPVKSGTLRRGWMAGKSPTGKGGRVAAQTNMQVTKKGSMYEIIIYNSVNYASYVEYGHRQEPGRFVPAIGKRLKASWVRGQFMLKISEQQLEAAAPGIIEKMLKPYLEEIFSI